MQGVYVLFLLLISETTLHKKGDEGETSAALTPLELQTCATLHVPRVSNSVPRKLPPISFHRRFFSFF